MSVSIPPFRPVRRAATYGNIETACVEPSLVAPPSGFDWVGAACVGKAYIIDELRCQNTGRRLARKRLRSRWREHAGLRRTLETELCAGLRMRSRYVVHVVDSRLHGPDPYLVLEWLPGETLASLLSRRARLPVDLCAWIIRQVAHGLRHLERAGFSHGALRASNVQISPAGAVKLIDLGESRPAGEPRQFSQSEMSNDEMCLPPEADGRALLPWVVDAYHLGVLSFRLLTGRFPFEAHSISGRVRLQHDGDAPSVLRWRADVPAELAKLTQRLLSRDPSDRPQSLHEIHRELMGIELGQMAGG